MATFNNSFIFPVEIFEIILSNVEECTTTRMANLKSCAMVCKLFAVMCRPRVFQSVDFSPTSKNFYAPGGGLYRLVHLAEVLEERPALANFVKELSIGPWSQVETRATAARKMVKRLSGHKDAFLLFSNLQTLSVKGDSHEDDWTVNAKALSRLCIELVRTYSSQPSVNTMAVRLESEPTPFLETFSSPYLRRLHLEDIDYPPEAIASTTSLVTHLTIERAERFPFSLISAFPHLQTLRLLNINTFENASGQHALPTSLTDLEISVAHRAWRRNPMCAFVEHYVAGAKASGFESFESLLKLKVTCHAHHDLHAVRSILDRVPSLRFLHIECTTSSSYRGFIDILLPVLDTVVRTACPSLAELNLVLPVANGTEAFGEILTPLGKFFANISGENKLEAISLRLRTSYPTTLEFPCEKSWSQIASVLALPTGFPKLRDIDIDLVLKAPMPVAETQTHTHMDTAQYFVRKYVDLMGGLALRKGVIFKGTVHISG